MPKHCWFVCFLLAYGLCNGQDTTRVEIDLKLLDGERLKVKVYPPADTEQKWKFVIPQIIPGTYMKINYVRSYRKIAAYDHAGAQLKTIKKGNVIHIRQGAHPLSHLEYEIEQSLGNGPVWDNILTCAGTIFTDSSYLFNFQLVNGYFEGYRKKPFKIIFTKEKDLYGAGSLKAITRTSQYDEFHATDYAELVDRPLLYATADTSSFQIKDHRFQIAVHSELGYVNASKVKPALQRIMHAVDTFSGFITSEDYYFILYYVNMDRIKGLFKTFGLGSALEHNASSVYYNSDYANYDTLFRNLDWIATHEYFHTIAPLTLHTEKIHDFNFARPDMSRHLWLYEGVTDYLSALVNTQSASLSNSMSRDFGYDLTYALKRKPRSLTQSSEHIIKSNMFNWLSKMLQLGNFYSKGKLVAFGIDMELLERSGGEMRLLDVLLKMRTDYEGKYIPDDQLLDKLAEYSFPEMRTYFAQYIEGKNFIPFKTYFEKLGWTYLAKGEEVTSYGRKMKVRYNGERQRYYIKKTGPNTIGLRKGDLLINIDGTEATLENLREANFFTKIYRPKSPDDEVTIKVERKGEEVILKGKASRKDKLRYPRIMVSENFTDKQSAFRTMFFDKQSE